MRSEIGKEIEPMSDAGELRLRPAEARDAEAVAELAAQLGYERTANQVREWLERLGARGGQAVFVAERGGGVVGWVDVSLEHRLQSETFGLIGGLVVKDGLRGTGIGRRLCERAEQWSAEQGAKKIRVTSRSTREDAHRFYLRDGYRQVKVSMVFEKRLER
jgi:GNAT superfamily N-acetyltransferase